MVKEDLKTLGYEDWREVVQSIVMAAKTLKL